MIDIKIIVTSLITHTGYNYSIVLQRDMITISYSCSRITTMNYVLGIVFSSKYMDSRKGSAYGKECLCTNHFLKILYNTFIPLLLLLNLLQEIAAIASPPDAISSKREPSTYNMKSFLSPLSSNNSDKSVSPMLSDHKLSASSMAECQRGENWQISDRFSSLRLVSSGF